MLRLNPTDIMTEKFILEVNISLAMENAGIERLQMRIAETKLPFIKQQLQQHLQESEHHQQKLQQIISAMDGQPTTEKLGLPIPSYPKPMVETMSYLMTVQEWELKKAEEDFIIENAEISFYLNLIQQSQMAGGTFLNLVTPLSQIMADELKMVEWIKNSTPNLLAQLWPTIQLESLKSGINNKIKSISPTYSITNDDFSVLNNNNGNSNINWNMIVGKEARGINLKDFGEVEKIDDDYIVTKKGLVNKDKFYLPKNLLEKFDGNTLWFKITEEDADSYKRG